MPLLSNLLVILLRSIILSKPNGQFFNCATAYSEQHTINLLPLT